MNQSNTGTYIFNPSTEIALATPGESFTPRRAVAEFERELSLLPALYAPAGSSILLLHCDENEARTLPYYDLAMSRGIKLYTLRSHATGLTPQPWGWNRQLRNLLIRNNFSAKALPTPEQIATIRLMASRSFTIPFIASMATKSSLIDTDLAPQCFTNATAAIDCIDMYAGRCVIKSPWSSSGRGIYMVADGPLEKAYIRVNQSIVSAGCVIIEPLHDKVCDFATEWECSDGVCHFAGISLFKADASGHYEKNIVASQSDIRRLISTYTPLTELDEIIELQRYAIDRLIAPRYTGPLGIDMLTTAERRIVPCVEINLRHTMGHVALALYKFYHKQFFFIPGKSVPQ